MERKLKHIFLVIVCCISTSGFTQNWELNEFLFQKQELQDEELLMDYKKYDFSNLWTAYNQEHTFGIIGENHQRFYIKFLTVEKDSMYPERYNITGKTKVKNNVCNFNGHIYIQNIKRLNKPEYGVDDAYEGKLIDQGVLHFEYEFFEDSEQKHSGIFVGYGISKWYLDTKDVMQYDDVQIHSDSYTNNAFIGQWQLYGGHTQKTCNWGDFRLPVQHKDFDIGAGEFSPSEKYLEYGWENYHKALKGDKDAILKEKASW